jgi:methylated-DNA-[protein]-cysteine S-methyltransferase
MTTPDWLILDRIASPLGEILYAADDTGKTYALDFADYESRMRLLLGRYAAGRALREGRLHWAREALQRYFDGDVAAIDPLAAHAGGTPFQCAVWEALRGIPAGATLSYSDLAASLKLPRAVRAVAAANARNPVAIIVPCHRVIGRDGQLTGYAGGVWRKQWLLKHEGVLQ